MRPKAQFERTGLPCWRTSSRSPANPFCFSPKRAEPVILLRRADEHTHPSAPPQAIGPFLLPPPRPRTSSAPLLLPSPHRALQPPIPSPCLDFLFIARVADT